MRKGQLVVIFAIGWVGGWGNLSEQLPLSHRAQLAMIFIYVRFCGFSFYDVSFIAWRSNKFL